eukprot:169723_1
MSAFCKAFRETYRMIKDETTKQQVRERHLKLYHYSRALFEAIEFFGEQMGPEMIVYHGLDCPLQFKQFNAYFDQPVSTTPSKKSAQEFSRGTGIIIALKAGTEHFDDASKIPKYLNVSSFSDFPNEDERLFYGSFVKFVIHNILEADTLKSHSKELLMFNTLQSMLDNKKMEWKKIDAVTKNIIASLKNEYNFKTKYSEELFDFFCKSQEKITIREYQSIPNGLQKLLFGNECQDDAKRQETNIMKLTLVNIATLFPNLTKLTLTQLNLSKMEKNANVYVDFVLNFIQSNSKIGMNLQKVQTKSIVE